MKLKIDKVLVYNIEFTEAEKLELCIELKKIDEEQYPAIVSLYKAISEVQYVFMS